MNNLTRYTSVPKGQIVWPSAGDVVLVKNNTLMSWIIRLGEYLRFHLDAWSHTAFAVSGDGDIIEALWDGVHIDNIDKYRNVEYAIVHTSETCLAWPSDLDEALRYVYLQNDKPYGYLTLIGTATRFLLPGHNFMFISSHNICSGLVAQALTRGNFISQVQPVTMSPTELAEELGVKA